MLFKKKLDQMVDVEQSEKRWKDTTENEKLEKKDGLAMFLAAFLVFFPALLIIAGIFVGLTFLFFSRG